MNEELKPCPFCGGKAERKEGRMLLDSYNYWYIECECCHTKSMGYRVPKEAIKAWNRRSE